MRAAPALRPSIDRWPACCFDVLCPAETRRRGVRSEPVDSLVNLSRTYRTATPNQLARIGQRYTSTRVEGPKVWSRRFVFVFVLLFIIFFTQSIYGIPRPAPPAAAEAAGVSRIYGTAINNRSVEPRRAHRQASVAVIPPKANAGGPRTTSGRRLDGGAR